VFEKQFGGRNTSRTGCPQKRGISGIVPRIGISSRVQEEVHCLGIAALCSPEQRGGPVLFLSGVNRNPVLQEDLHYFRIGV
jgi:hypothetical protein